MTYPEVIKYLESFINYERISHYPYKQSFKLERIEEFLNNLGDPQDKLKSIHIAGTKGKGSTCAFIANILRQAQFKAGLYTSPHLSDFRERIRILNPSPERRFSLFEYEGMISEEELIALVEKLRPDIDKYNSQSIYGALSFFEVYTALAFEYFKEKEVDFAVLETGLGGRLDATNTVNSLIAAITSISYEHTRQLGRTLTEIASEKAGIIKSSSQLTAHSLQLITHNLQAVVITAPQEKEVIEVIRNRCKKEDAILYEIGKDITFERVELCRNYQCFDINGVFGKVTDLKINLLGTHQIINATLAAAVVLALNKFFKVRLKLEAIKNGLYNTIWPGRFEIISKKPLVVLDGAQNLASAKALRETVNERFPGKRIVLVLGVSKDKDIAGICKELCPLACEIILTQADNPRAADVDTIKQTISSQLTASSSQLYKAKRVEDAIELAKKRTRVEDLILVTGSLFLVGEAREFLLKKFG